MYILSFDNGVSGGVSVLNEQGEVLLHSPTPIKKELSYTKAKNWIHRLNFQDLVEMITPYKHCKCFIERPMVNPGRFKATISAIRCLEATLIVLEQLNIPIFYLDSKEWQRKLLPSGLVKEELKTAAKQIAKRKFPNITIHNADSLLIAEYGRLYG